MADAKETEKQPPQLGSPVRRASARPMTEREIAADHAAFVRELDRLERQRERRKRRK
jgi:hypothetical protein